MTCPGTLCALNSVREPVEGVQIRICCQQETIAQHRLSRGRGEMIIDPAHYAGLPRRSSPAVAAATTGRELQADPGVGHHFQIPEVEVRPLAIYEEVSYVPAV